MYFMTFEQLLLSLGVNLTSSVVYDVVKEYFQQVKNPTAEGLAVELARHLNIDGATIKAENIISFLAKNGDISISDSYIFASKSIIMESSLGTQFTFGNNSVSQTEKSSIEAGHGTQITGSGSARIEQDEDSNINFSV